MSYNYWDQQLISDPTIISDNIYDYCAGNDYTTIIKFWPWLQTPYINGDNLPVMKTIDATTNTSASCNEIESATSYISVHIQLNHQQSLQYEPNNITHQSSQSPTEATDTPSFSPTWDLYGTNGKPNFKKLLQKFLLY